MSEETNDFFMEARPQISVFVAENGNLQIDVSQMNGSADRVEFNSVEIPPDCVQQVAEAMLRIVKN
ncbi:hypothetical protein HSX11_01615 [Oxalobacteraceae bacterium]|nr:hypothetical protein [Oxalobacteraceae bacterium]